ncbi:MAG: hypothetical protein RLZ70_1399, partial [Verrucomicrobiota bacterium]
MYPPAHPSAVRSLTHHLSVVAATLFCLGSTLSAESRLPGIQTATLDAALKGRLLLEELNCVACHAAPAGADLKSQQAPRLAEVAQRVNPTYLETFIRSPHTTKPGTAMPDLLAKLPEGERAATAQQLTHFLLSLKASTFAPQAPDGVAAAQGEKLFHARGCAACHSPRDAQGRETLAAKSVPLGALEQKYSFRSLVDFLRQPHQSRPSGRMPDLKLPARELESIAHYLLRDTRVPGHLNYTMYRGQVWEGIGHEAVEPERGGYTSDFSLSNLDRIHHHMALRFEGWLNVQEAGDYEFFLKANGATLTIDGKEVAALTPKDRRGVQAFTGKTALSAGKHPIRLDYYHTGREPSLSFEVAGPNFPRQAIASALLSVSDKPIPAFSRPTVDAQLASSGRQKFSQLGCVSCHNDVGVPASAPAIALTMADVTRGCLDSQSLKGARFDLSAEQVSWIHAALKQGFATALTPEQTLHTELTRFNCIA